MTKDEFINDLPASAVCESCQRKIGNINWTIRPWIPRDWMAIGIVKCERCSWLKIAAAGSSESAHKAAQDLRLKLVVQMGL